MRRPSWVNLDTLGAVFVTVFIGASLVSWIHARNDIPVHELPVRVLWIDEDTTVWNGLAGEQVNVIMQRDLRNDLDPEQRCLQMGGDFYYDEPHRLMVCASIDF